MASKSLLILSGAIGFLFALGACTGQSEKTGDGGVSVPIIAPTGQTDTSAPKTDVPTAGTPRPDEASGATNNNGDNVGKKSDSGNSPSPTPVGVGH